jgi:adhesin transport system membrane fusion protein
MATSSKRLSRRDIAYLTREEALEQLAPSRLGAFAAILIVGLLVAAVAWSAYVRITTVATAPGEIIPSGDERVVQHLEGGIVREIRVTDGAVVEQGEVLIRFDPTLRKAELDQVRAREAALTIRERRLRALIDGAESVDYADLAAEYPTLVEEATISLMAARERTEGQIAVLRAQIEQRARSVRIFDEQVSSLARQEELVTEVTELREGLFERGIESRVNLIASQLEQSRVQGALTEARVSREQAQLSISELETQIREIELNERSSAMEELSTVLAELAEVRENRERLDDRVNRLTVTAPVAGVVHRMRVNTPGAVVEPAQVLMTVVPLDEDVVVDVRISPTDIGHLRLDQLARVTISGFDARRYGVMTGRLTQISATTYESEDGQTYFKGRILLDENTVDADGVSYAIVPGMTLSADIATGDQTLLEYLTRPIYVAVTGAFSER